MDSSDCTKAHACAERVRAVRELLFGRTLGNKYRQQADAIRCQSTEGLRQAACLTRAALIDKVFEDHTLATLFLSSLVKRRRHGAMIFLALDLANLSLMNPELAGNHQQWVEDISTSQDQPVALVLRCLEWISGESGGQIEQAPLRGLQYLGSRT